MCWAKCGRGGNPGCLHSHSHSHSHSLPCISPALACTLACPCCLALARDSRGIAALHIAHTLTRILVHSRHAANLSCHMGPLRLSVRLNHLHLSIARSTQRLLELTKHWLSMAHESFAPYSLANRPTSPAYARPSISGDGSFTPALCPELPECSVPVKP